LTKATPFFGRRQFLRAAAAGGGSMLAGANGLLRCLGTEPQEDGAFRGGKLIRTIDFVDEANIETNTISGTELDGRLYTDLSTLKPGQSTVPAKNFYVRTRASNLLPASAEWQINVTGADPARRVPISEIKSLEQPIGIHLLECAGNTKAFHFGLMSAASWSGVPLSKFFAKFQLQPATRYVLISGFDRYETESAYSVPGASWIFTLDQLISSNAFLATVMDSQPLTRDHGAPVRLFVPGWYGCACIKWVDEIAFLSDDASPATSQMREYAARTHQQGVPEHARDFKPAQIQFAATPIRVEQWSVQNATKYRVVGILWGGTEKVRRLQIRFNPEEDYVPVDHLTPSSDDTWSYWSHVWSPKESGNYSIRLRIQDPVVATPRLDSGYYVRTVQIERGA
jgi:DMSO/TMAO reductase YedYZ molybdopterin-dependent catalytic subunit